ncbi:MAG: hypothetical protein IJ709_10765 [Selenomonas sp.]|nr:hypothetical protein [Selenomonas sp.]
MLKFNKEGSPMWIWKFRLLIDEKPYEALVHSFTHEGALKRLQIVARKSAVHAHYIRDIQDVQVEDDLYDDTNPAHEEYIVRSFVF